jgi:nucleotide-binding universal stress UspA family protein
MMMEECVCQIRRILLAVNQAQQPGHLELRAGLLGSQLKLRSLDMVATRVVRPLLGRVRTLFSQIRVDNSGVDDGALSAFVKGETRMLRLPLDPGELEQLWTDHAGSTAEAIAEVAEQRKADLLVLAAPRRHPLLEWVLPSPAMQVLRTSRIPVLLVKQAPRRAYRKVVVATDFSPASIKAARTACLIAPEAHFIFLHAWRLPEERLMRELELRPELVALYRSRARDAAQRRLASCFADFSSHVTRASSMLGHGAPHRVIEACARQVGADLIVLGRGAGTASGRPGVGMATRRLVAGADCDVLIDE